MAFTPLDPTKAEVKVIQEGEQLEFDFYIPRGAKGEPGGLTSTVVPNNTDLDQYITPGAYSVAAGTDAAASALAHLPMHESGAMLVTTSQSGVIQIQTYTTNTKSIYVRRRFNGVWSGWRTFNSTRVSEAAGRAIYQWDELNQREQLVWGDTGRRNMNALVPSAVSGSIILSRYGNMVTLLFADYLDNSPGSIVQMFGLLPVGFRPANWIYNPMVSSRTIIVQNGGQVNVTSPGSVTSNTVVYQGTFSWRTEEPWPTTLPGVAVGSIPNT